MGSPGEIQQLAPTSEKHIDGPGGTREVVPLKAIKLALIRGLESVAGAIPIFLTTDIFMSLVLRKNAFKEPNYQFLSNFRVKLTGALAAIAAAEGAAEGIIDAISHNKQVDRLKGDFEQASMAKAEDPDSGTACVKKLEQERSTKVEAPGIPSR